MRKRIKNYFIVFGIGAVSYGLIEITVRGFTHPSMLLTGGAVLCTLFFIHTHFEIRNPLLQSLLGGAVITLYEYNVGMIVNVAFGMNVWDYSDIPFNLFGQICLKFTVGWCLLSLPATKIVFFLRKKLEG